MPSFRSVWPTVIVVYLSFIVCFRDRATIFTFGSLCCPIAIPICMWYSRFFTTQSPYCLFPQHGQARSRAYRCTLMSRIAQRADAPCRSSNKKEGNYGWAEQESRN
ncbi:hypothetical protein BKA83DRAFT_4262752 [Pisolithus microcarpus]|nr:hypothetical protein BKA83DRAFT_4262752 [Pisolithus microcarpus]